MRESFPGTYLSRIEPMTSDRTWFLSAGLGTGCKLWVNSDTVVYVAEDAIRHLYSIFD